MDILSSNFPQDNHEQKRRPGGQPKNGKYSVSEHHYSHAYYDRNYESISRASRKYRRKTKTKVFAHYSGSAIPFCACCGEDILEFLTIDHINGDGALHRKNIPNNGRNSLYRWLILNDYPEGFQVLCYNCNCAKGFYGCCPHEKVSEKQLLLIKM